MERRSLIGDGWCDLQASYVVDLYILVYTNLFMEWGLQRLIH